MCTYALLEALKGQPGYTQDGAVNTLHRESYVALQAPDLAEKAFNTTQSPYVSRDGRGGGFEIVGVGR